MPPFRDTVESIRLSYVRLYAANSKRSELEIPSSASLIPQDSNEPSGRSLGAEGFPSRAPHPSYANPRDFPRLYLHFTRNCKTLDVATRGSPADLIGMTSHSSCVPLTNPYNVWTLDDLKPYRHTSSYLEGKPAVTMMSAIVSPHSSGDQDMQAPSDSRH